VNRNFLSFLLLDVPLQRTRRVGPARCPGRVLLWQVPLARPFPSIPPRPVARPCSGLLSTTGLSDFPGPFVIAYVLDFPMRPKATAARGGLGISRFPREVSRYVHGVSDARDSGIPRDIGAPDGAFRFSLQRRRPEEILRG